mmetsp:Transcript_18622/g.45543  ORF Transcript_18622/g.45543 Transcript_18622/m.45543 type:complete len:262 (+) Transcript_18622:54-839(+)
MDSASFRVFAPLLVAAGDYADHSGFRYRSSSFEDLDEATSPRAQQRVGAKLKCLAEVVEFQEALKSADDPRRPGLIAEFETAQDLVTKEAVRTAMIASCSSLGLWPPPEEGDNPGYQDTSADLVTIASRLWVDEKLRDENPEAKRRMELRAKTASFVTDFGISCGLQLSECPGAEMMLKEFLQRVKEYSEETSKDSAPVKAAVMKELNGLRARPQWVNNVESWVDENRGAVAVAAGLLAVGGAMLAMYSAHQNKRRRDRQE